MIKTFLIAVSAIGILAAGALSFGDTRGQEVIGPAENFTCVKNGAWPHEELCDYFVDCWLGEDDNWIATLCRCTEGYLFDLNYMGCNFPEMVDCANRTKPNGTEPIITTLNPESTTTKLPVTGTGPTEPPGEFECPVNTGYFPDPLACEWFYQCEDGVAYHQQCPPPLVFNPNEHVLNCDHRDNVPSCKEY